jgi:hypothetical protein
MEVGQMDHVDGLTFSIRAYMKVVTWIARG